MSVELDIPAGQTLVHAGDPGSGMFVIAEGTAIVEARGETMIEVGPGEFVGELALLVPEAIRSARVRAKTDVRCLAIVAGDFRSCSTTSRGSRSRCCPSRRAAVARPRRARPRRLQSSAMAEKLIADNRKARHDYQLLERVEAGLVLTGTEVKSLRDGRATLGQAYADVRDGEAWLHGAEIADLRPGQPREPRADPRRASCCCTAARSTGSTARCARRA